MADLIKWAVVLILVYLAITIFLKATRFVLRLAIVLLIILIIALSFVDFGSLLDIFSSEESQTVQPNETLINEPPPNISDDADTVNGEAT